MRTKMCQHQRFGVRLLINKEKVGADMALSVAYPSPNQYMISIPFGKGLIRGQQAGHPVKVDVQGISISPAFLSSIIATE